jgi:hypothetical protein
MAVDIDVWLERIGGFLSGAFGPRFAIGALIGLMKDITPFQCYEFIRDNKGLFPDLTEDDWGKVREFMQKAHLENIDIEQVRKQFKRRRPDLLQVIVNQPKGEEWLENQVALLKVKLGIQPGS